MPVKWYVLKLECKHSVVLFDRNDPTIINNTLYCEQCKERKPITGMVRYDRKVINGIKNRK